MSFGSNNFSFHTKRLFIRKLELSDINELYKLESKKEVVQYVTGKVLTYKETEEKLKMWLETFDYKNGFGALAIFLKEEKEFIGVCGILENDEIGYRFLPDYWKKGYGTEILDWLILYAESLGLEKLIAEVVKENIGSLKLLEKHGFNIITEQYCKNTGLPEFVLKLELKQEK